MTEAGRYGLILAAIAAAVWIVRRAAARLLLSRAKHRSLAGHPRWARRLARWLPAISYDEAQFFHADGAPEAVVACRRAAIDTLRRWHAERYPKSTVASRAMAQRVVDLEFTARYRVPFQFSAWLRTQLPAAAVLQASEGRWLVDLDGNHSLDLTGSYGVNLFGNEFYKQSMARGAELVAPLGAVLGSLHPVVDYNARRLCEISGLDAVSFHMSGTEAVMQAVRLARYHTGRSRLVRFCGAYHGWWGDVQPGVGNPQVERDTFTLADLSPLALRVLETRTDIACVLVNPLQALHPNSTAPADSQLMVGARRAGFDRAAYAAWLQQLREVCTRRGIVLIMDEVMMGFRLGIGGAQEYFGMRADLVTYGKSLGGGLPVGVLCGRRELMQRFREDRPADICFARGTFNAHPHVMGAMHEFLRHLETPGAQQLLADADTLWSARATDLNARLAAAGVPLRVAALGSVWTFLYEAPSRYHWMLQYYLRAEGLTLSWVGSGRAIFSLDYTGEEYAEVVRSILAAAQRMQEGGWWWSPPVADPRRALRRELARELIQVGWRAWSGSISSPRKRWKGARQ
ncbi:MAG TPA: aminotransferase class III-fold pyridoxal phosphate-dependent enzyme [Steroidobacteraceae bacterium]|nr:aminotransferase class III-fold pyridoxal phosphate-dependent enzyme [Steroidobacteraceae bacterium]